MLGQVEADIGAEVVAEVVRLVRSRGGLDAARVIYGAVRDGRGPALIAEARQQIADRPESADDRPSARQARDLCPRCSRPGHRADDCPDRDPPPPLAGVPPPAAAVEPCRAGERCLVGEPAPVNPASGYHARCAEAAAARARLTARAPAPASADRLAAEQVAESRAAREDADCDQAAAVAS